MGRENSTDRLLAIRTSFSTPIPPDKTGHVPCHRHKGGARELDTKFVIH